MRICLLTFVGLLGFALRAQDSLGRQPIYMNPSSIRALQAKFSDDSPRLGPFGLSQPAAARFGWDRVQQDSSFAFAAAQTLWLDYFCLFGDSLCADLALVRSPRFAWSEEVESKYLASETQFSSAQVFRSNPMTMGGNELGGRGSVAEVRAPTRISVRAGDSFYRIMSRYPNLKLEQLYAANKGSDRIYPGQILVIP